MTNTDIQAYDIAAFCRAFGISRSLAYLEIKAGRLRRFKAGRRTLISREAADAWRRGLEEQAAQTRAPDDVFAGHGGGARLAPARKERR